jgi:hypothetical protein
MYAWAGIGGATGISGATGIGGGAAEAGAPGAELPQLVQKRASAARLDPQLVQNAMVYCWAAAVRMVVSFRSPNWSRELDVPISVG